MSTAPRPAAAFRSACLALACVGVLTVAAPTAFAGASSGVPAAPGDPYRPLQALDARLARSDQGVQAEIAQRLDEASRRNDRRATLIALRDQVLAWPSEPLPADRLQLIDGALKLARDLHDDETACVLQGQAGAALAQSGDWDNATRAFDDGARLCAGHDYALGTVYLARGNAEYDRNDATESLAWLDLAYRLFSTLGAVEQTSTTLTYIAAAIRMPETATTEDLRKAAEYLVRARDMLDPGKHRMLIISAMHDLGLTYQRQHDGALARGEWSRALELATLASSPYNMALLEFRIGTLDLDEGRPAQAKAAFDVAIPEFMKRDGQQIFGTLSLLKRGKAEALLKHRDAAYADLGDGCDRALGFGWPRIVGECYQTTADIGVEFGDYKAAHGALQQLVSVERAARQRTAMAQLEELKVRFDMKLKTAENALLKSKETASESRRATLALTLALVVVVLVAVAALLWLQMRQKKRFAVLAMFDELTGAPNRRSMHDLVAREFGSRRPGESSLWVGILDLDHFKSINDGLGHAVGDAVLREIYQVCHGALRRQDVFGRWGGEEFLLVLRDVDADAVHALYDRLSNAVASMSIAALGTRSITFSMGVCEAREVASVEDLIKRADDALYLAKAQGRARCVIAEPRTAPSTAPSRRSGETTSPLQSAAAMMLPSR